jgi:peptide/nickel transport system ATP-binding protein
MSIAGIELTKVFDQKGRGRAATPTPALRGVSFELLPGETLGLVGESGSGKSTLARIVLGLIEPTGGRVEFDGRDLDLYSRTDWREYRRQVQVVFQDPRSALNWKLGIEEIVTEPLRNYGIGDKRSRRARAVELLEQVDVSSRLLERRPPEVSGGQLQRVAIARALALAPTYLICDEPLSALDVSVQAGVLNLLLDLQAARGLSLLFISHDLEVVRHLSDRVMVMFRGEIVEQASAQRLYTSARHSYSRTLLGLPVEEGGGPDPDTPPEEAPEA